MNGREEREAWEMLEELSSWEQFKFLWYVRWLLARQTARIWLHSTRLALNWTYVLIEADSAREDGPR